MAPDSDLLRQYAENRDEAAFAEVVRQYVDLVYATALRLLNGDAHLAQDVTQTVFTDLARHTAALRERATVAGWLHTSARFHASKTVRTERRRRAREQEALAMSDQNTSAEFSWEQLRPLLDEAVGQLTDADRDAVLLRFFQGKSHREVGVILGLDENTARMRVERTLDKLRSYFSKRGVTTTAALLATTLGAQAASTPAPAAFAATVAGQSLAGIGGAAGGVSGGLAGGVGKSFLGMKWLAGVAVVVLLAGLAFFFFSSREKAPTEASNTPTPPTNSSNSSVIPPTPSPTQNNMNVSQIINRGTVAAVALLAATTAAPAQTATANITPPPASAQTIATPFSAARTAAPTMTAPTTNSATALDDGLNTMMGRLNLAQSNLEIALAALNQVPTTNYGGFVERAKTDVGKSLTDVTKGIEYVQANPETNPVIPGAPLASQMKRDAAVMPVWRAPTLPYYAQYEFTTQARNAIKIAPQSSPDTNLDMLKAYAFSNKAYFGFDSGAATNGMASGDIGGYKEMIFGDIAQVTFDVVSGLDYAHGHAAKLSVLASAGGELVLNGDFESPMLKSPNTSTFEPMNTVRNFEPSSFGWRIRSGTLTLMHVNYKIGVVGPFSGAAASGQQWLNLDGYSPGAIEQTIDTTAGSRYTLTFAYANSPNPGIDHPFAATINVKDVVSNTDLITPIEITHNTSTTSDFHWDHSAPITFTATGSTSTIRFTSNDITGHDGIFIDSVSVKPAATAAAATTAPSKP